MQDNLGASAVDSALRASSVFKGAASRIRDMQAANIIACSQGLFEGAVSRTTLLLCVREMLAEDMKQTTI